MINYTAAKKVMDFYIKALENDIENSEAHFVLQMAQLKLLKYNTNCYLNTLESYSIDVEQ